MRVALLVLAVAAALAGCAQAPATTWSSLHAKTMDELAAARAGASFGDFLVPYVVEAAALGGLDPNAWPADHPVARDLANLTAFQPRLAYALALAHPGDATVAARVRAHVEAAFDGEQFGDRNLTLDDAFALLTLATVGPLPPAAAVAAVNLRDAADAGGWSYRIGATPDVDSTGMVVLALAAAGTPAEREAVLAFLLRSRHADGGWGAGPGDDANCDSTVWAIRAHLALDEPVPAAAWSHLAALRVPGGWAYQSGQAANGFCSVEVATLFAAASQEGLPVPAAFFV